MSRYSAQTVIKEGFAVIELKDAAREAAAEIIPELGSNLFRFDVAGRRILQSPASLQVLKNDASAAFKYGTPMLFPPNRIKNGSFAFDGRRYNLPINEPPDRHLHGEIGSKPWEVVVYGASEESGAYVTTRFRYASHPEILRYFPHPLVFTVTCRLQDGQLHLDGSIVNEGEEEAPFAFGLHPYFTLPYETGESMILTVPAAEEWPVTNEAFVTGEPSATAFSRSLNEGVNITDYPVLGCSLIGLSGGKENICRIAMNESGYTIAYRLDDAFPFLLLFRPDWASAYSLEPYTYVTDAFNLPYERTGAKGIRAGEEIRFATGMWVENH